MFHLQYFLTTSVNTLGLELGSECTEVLTSCVIANKSQ